MAGVEDFLAAAAEQFRQPAGEQRHDAGAEHAGNDAARDPDARGRRRRGHRHDDADDQAGFENLAKDDQQRRQHGNLMALYCGRPDDHGTTRKPCVVMVKVVVEIVAAGLLAAAHGRRASLPTGTIFSKCRSLLSNSDTMSIEILDRESRSACPAARALRRVRTCDP